MDRKLGLVALVAFVLCTGGLLAPVHVVFADESLLTRLRAEAPKQWTELERFHRSIDAEGIRIDKVLKSKTRQPTEKRQPIHFLVSGDLLLAEISRTEVVDSKATADSTTDAIVIASGEKSSFMLRRPKGSHEWVIEFVGPSIAPEMKTDFSRRIGTYVNAPASFCGVSLGELIERSGFSFTDAEELPDGMIRAHYTYVPEDETQAALLSARNGWIVFDPQRDWCVCEFTYTVAGGDKFHGDIAYVNAETGYRPVKSVTINAVSATGDTAREFAFVFSRYEHRSISPTEISLPKYGLPEYASHSRGSWLPYILLGIAILLIASGMAVRRRNRALVS